MKSLLTLLAASLCAHAVPVATPVGVTIIQNDYADPFEQQLVFDVVWGPGPGPSANTIALAGGDGLVRSVLARDYISGVQLAIETPYGELGLYVWNVLLTYGADRTFASIAPSFGSFPVVSTHPTFPFVKTLDAELLPGEPYGGRFTLNSMQSEEGLAHVPDTGTTALLLLALGLLALAHRKCVSRN